MLPEDLKADVLEIAVIAKLARRISKGGASSYCCHTTSKDLRRLTLLDSGVRQALKRATAADGSAEAGS